MAAPYDHENVAKDAPPEGGPRRLVDTSDAILSLLLLAGCGLIYYVTTTFDSVPEVVSQNITPAAFPRILVVIIALLALALPFEHRLGGEGWARIKADRAVPLGSMTWLSIAFVILVALAAPYLGTVLTMLVTCAVLPLLWGERRWWRVLAFAALFTAVVTLLFNLVLGVYFEPGVLG